MYSVTSDNLTYLKFKATDKLGFVKHAVSTRHGGVSTIDGLESLNLGTYTSDSIDNVRENYRRFCRAAGFDEQRIVLGNQTHSVNIRYATESDCGKGVFRERDYTDVDALITDCKNLPLVIHTADCVPVTFIDTAKHVIGSAHCGWRGTFGELAGLTIDAMTAKFSTDASDLVCTIGPCICQSCYEVSRDLYLDFLAKFGQSDALSDKNGSYYIDLSAINKQVLLSRGVKEENIILSDLCTCCNTNILYSHRGQGTKRGIFATFLQLV